MTPQDKNAKIAEVQKGLEALSALQKDVPDILLDPTTHNLMFKALQFFLGFLGSLFGLGKGSAVAQDQQTELLTQIAEQSSRSAENTKKILTHLETTCMKKDQIEALLGGIKQQIIDGVGADVPGHLLNTEGELQIGGAKVGKVIMQRKT